MAAKFCYGVKIDLSTGNVDLLRWRVPRDDGGVFQGNLIAKTTMFVSQSVLKSLRDSVRALKSCERVMELAESLEISQRCVEAVVSKASSADPSLFGWPVNDRAASRGRDLVNRLLWNGVDGGNRRKGVSRGTDSNSWLEDLSLMSLSLFKRLISTMNDVQLSSEVIESCLMHYAKKYIPETSRSSRKPQPVISSSASSSSAPSERDQREFLETITSYLPESKPSRSSTVVQFIFGLLRTTNILNASEDCRSVLERRIGAQLVHARVLRRGNRAQSAASSIKTSHISCHEGSQSLKTDAVC